MIGDENGDDDIEDYDEEKCGDESNEDDTENHNHDKHKRILLQNMVFYREHSRPQGFFNKNVSVCRYGSVYFVSARRGQSKPYTTERVAGMAQDGLMMASTYP